MQLLKWAAGIVIFRWQRISGALLRKKFWRSWRRMVFWELQHRFFQCLMMDLCSVTENINSERESQWRRYACQWQLFSQFMRFISLIRLHCRKPSPEGIKHKICVCRLWISMTEEIKRPPLILHCRWMPRQGIQKIMWYLNNYTHWIRHWIALSPDIACITRHFRR